MSTFLQLTNRLLRRLNEVELTSSNFSGQKGIHATCKDAILDTIRKINNKRFDWPFNSSEGTQTLVVGTTGYSWPADFVSVDWDSFQLQKDDTLGVGSTILTYIPREVWYESFKDMDDDATADGRGIPSFVFPTHGQGWGLSPSPNKAYKVKFKYFVAPTDLSAHGDETVIPERFDYVIIAGGMYHLSLFKDDPQKSQILKIEFMEGLNDMVNQLTAPPQRQMYDTRV